jgi:hypothetical protein
VPSISHRKFTPCNARKLAYLVNPQPGQSLTKRLTKPLAAHDQIDDTIAPPSARPDSGVPHHLEHFASFFIAGALWYMGHPRNLLLCLTLTVLFAGGLELLQLWVPGRHVRVH